MENSKKYLLYFLILVYVSGAIGYLFQPQFFSPFTPFTLLYTCFVFLLFQEINNKKYLFSFLAIALIGYVSEVIGVKTGLVFGAYHYQSALGFKVLEVPFVISLNWALLINIGILVASYFFTHPIKLALASAFIITTLDVLIEQIATDMHYWHFDSGIAGIHNYVAWFLISFFTALLFQQNMLKGNKKIALLFIMLQVFFFGLIYLNTLIKFVNL
jgi:putative membrane protein